MSPPETAIALFQESLMNVLSNPDNSTLPYYRELVPTLKSVRTSCLQMFDAFITSAKVSATKIPQLPVVVQGENEAGPGAFGLEFAEKIVNETYQKLMKNLSPTYRMSANQTLEDSKHRITVAIQEANTARTHRTTGILSVYAAAVLALNGIPKKLNPIIRSLMDSVKQEESVQQRSAIAVAHLIKELKYIKGSSG